MWGGFFKDVGKAVLGLALGVLLAAVLLLVYEIARGFLGFV